MNLDSHVAQLHEQLALAAEAGGDEARALAQRLTAPLDSAVRLMLLDALSAAAAEITRELAPGSVELRLRGGEPEFAVIAGEPAEPSEPAGELPPAPAADAEGSVSRINLRLPDRLKAQVEAAADREGLSTNAWLVRAVSAAVERGDAGARRERRTPLGGQSFSGWSR
jgi:hypothetical protein